MYLIILGRGSGGPRRPPTNFVISISGRSQDLQLEMCDFCPQIGGLCRFRRRGRNGAEIEGLLGDFQGVFVLPMVLVRLGLVLG